MDEIGGSQGLERQSFSMRMQGPKSSPPHKLTLHADLQAQWGDFCFSVLIPPLRLLPAPIFLMHATYWSNKAKVKRHCCCTCC